MGGGMMTTLVHKHPEHSLSRAVLLGIYSTFLMADHLIW